MQNGQEIGGRLARARGGNCENVTLTMGNQKGNERALHRCRLTKAQLPTRFDQWFHQTQILKRQKACCIRRLRGSGGGGSDRCCRRRCCCGQSRRWRTFVATGAIFVQKSRHRVVNSIALALGRRRLSILAKQGRHIDSCDQFGPCVAQIYSRILVDALYPISNHVS